MGEDDYSWLLDPSNNFSGANPSGGGTIGTPAGSPDLLTDSPVSPGGPGDTSGTGVSLPNIGNFLTQGLKSLGLTNANGDPNLLALMGVLGPIIGGLYTKSQTSKANDILQGAITNANQAVTSNLGNNAAIYAPYQQAGAMGLQRLENMPQSNLAARYKPLGTGAGFSLGNVASGR